MNFLKTLVSIRNKYDINQETLLMGFIVFMGAFSAFFLWVLDFIYHMSTPFNRVAMPLTATVLISLGAFLFFSPKYRSQTKIALYFYLSVYFQLDIYDILLSAKNPHYALLLISQFFPVLYLLSHACFSQRSTLIAWINYFIFMSTFLIIFSIYPDRFDKHFTKEVIAVLISQPIYLGCLHFILQLRRRVSESQTREQTLSSQLVRDPLTSIYNRIAIQKRMEDDAQNPNKPPIAIFVIDIDFFKKVNDTYGHSAGDLVLKKVAQALSSSVRNHDIVARWGGEEFMVIAYHLTDSQARSLGDRLLKSVNSIYPSEDSSTYITLSIGMAYRHDSNQTIPELIELADEQVYVAKHNGRNQLCIHSKSN